MIFYMIIWLRRSFYNDHVTIFCRMEVTCAKLILSAYTMKRMENVENNFENKLKNTIPLVSKTPETELRDNQFTGDKDDSDHGISDEKFQRRDTSVIRYCESSVSDFFTLLIFGCSLLLIFKLIIGMVTTGDSEKAVSSVLEGYIQLSRLSDVPLRL